MGHHGHPSSAGCVIARLIEPAIEATAFNTLALDVIARNADNIRTITTAAVLYPSTRFIEPVLPQEFGQFKFASLTFLSAVHDLRFRAPLQGR